ncbi:MAG: hypothetical protein Q8Q31_01985 [Nanoarchaeota archaeon]|nr:hypothetical protein [Nanoarchaeota archaeon]
MALLRFEDVKKMDKKARAEKIQELKLELVKANVTAHKSAAKTKEIKRAIARLITFNTSDKEVLKGK